MNDRELLKKARKGWELGSDCSITDLFDRFEQMLGDKEPKPKSIVWEPKKGDQYFYVAATGYLNASIWVGSDYELALLKHHNVYKTSELAEKASPYQRRYNMVLKKVLELEPDQVVYWSDKNQTKYQIYFDHKSGRWKDVFCTFIDGGYPVLTDKKNVQPLLDYLNSKEKEQ